MTQLNMNGEMGLAYRSESEIPEDVRGFSYLLDCRWKTEMSVIGRFCWRALRRCCIVETVSCDSFGS